MGFTVAWNWKVAVAPGASDADRTTSALGAESSTVAPVPPLTPASVPGT